MSEHDPVIAAIGSLLHLLSDSWQHPKQTRESSLTEDAAQRAINAGLIEACYRVAIEMAGRDERAEVTLSAAGPTDIVDAAVGSLPPKLPAWFDDQGATAGSVQATRDLIGMRLTPEGVRYQDGQGSEQFRVMMAAASTLEIDAPARVTVETVEVVTPESSELHTIHVANWTISAYPSAVAKLLGIDKRTLLADRTIAHEQLNPPKGRKYRFDFDAIEKRNPEAAQNLNPDTSA